MVGLVLLIGGLGMVASAIVDLIDGGPDAGHLVFAGGPILLLGAALWRGTIPHDRMGPATIFAAVLASWMALSLAGTIPYLTSGMFTRFDDALFEMVSGFTTTGATVLRPIEGHSAGMLFWRSVTQWIGGIGVVVFAVSVLPFLGVGGMDLLAAEAPGPTSERLVPRVRETAKRLCLLYLAFTTLIAAAYAAFGMSPYDAVTHAFTTISTGGFSQYNASFGHFDSAALEWTAIVAMFVAGGSFALYWAVLMGRPGPLLRSVEARTYTLLMVGYCTLAVSWTGLGEGLGHDVVRQTTFTVVAVASSTGYTLLDYDAWGPVVKLMLVFAMALGGMAGSTTGGFKVFRLIAMLAYGRRQLRQELRPRAVAPVRLGRDIVPEGVMGSIAGFSILFMATGAIATLLLAVFGADPVTAISAVATAIGNVGPGLGEVGPTRDFLDLHPAGRLVLMVVMLAGRLEIFPVLLGFAALVRSLQRLRQR